MAVPFLSVSFYGEWKEEHDRLMCNYFWAESSLSSEVLSNDQVFREVIQGVIQILPHTLIPVVKIWITLCGRLEGKTKSNAFLMCTITLEMQIHMTIFKNISWRNDGHNMGNNSPICISMFVVFVFLKNFVFEFHE